MNRGVLALVLMGGSYVIYKFATPTTQATEYGDATPVAATAPPPVDASPAPGNLGVEPRGIRNNNPTNIVYSSANNWQGQIGSDGHFAKFSDAVYGIRAFFVLLKTYGTSYGLVTLSEIAQRWAPSNENDPVAYAVAVSDMSGYPIDAPLPWSDPASMIDIARGFIGMENGRAWSLYYSSDTIQQALGAS